MLNVSDADPLKAAQFKRGVQKIVSRMSPAIRIPFEFFTGETAYTQRPLTDLGVMEYLKENYPLSRFHRVASKVGDPEENLAISMVDLLTGVRTYPVNPDRARLDELKRQYLYSGKGTRSGFLVIRRKGVDPHDKTATRLQKEIAKLSRKIAEDRKRKSR